MARTHKDRPAPDVQRGAGRGGGKAPGAQHVKAQVGRDRQGGGGGGRGGGGGKKGAEHRRETGRKGTSHR